LFVDDTLLFLYVVYHLRRCMRVHVLTYYDIFRLLSALTSKTRCFILAHNIRPKFGRTFGNCSVSLPKPSASAECHNVTFGPSLVCLFVCLWRVDRLFVTSRLRDELTGWWVDLWRVDRVTSCLAAMCNSNCGISSESVQCAVPVTHVQTWASYSTLYRFGRLSIIAMLPVSGAL